MTIEYRARRRFSYFLLGISFIWLLGCGNRIGRPSDQRSGRHGDGGHESEHHAFHNHSHDVDAGEDHQGKVLEGWFNDDYEAARIAAENAHVPLVIDIWAKWCSPCIDMHRRVIRHPNVIRFEEQFVWLMLDTDAAANHFPFHLFKTDKWPTYLVVNPLDEQELARLEGAQAVTQFVAFLEAGQRAFEKTAVEHSERERFEAVRSARRAAYSGEFEEAAEFYEDALTLEPEPLRRAELLRSMVWALKEDEEYEECAALSERVVDSPILTSVELEIIKMGLLCSRQERRDLNRDFFKVISAYMETHESSEVIIQSERLKLLRTFYVQGGKPRLAYDVAVAHRKMLDDLAANAPSEHEALRWDRARAEVYLFLKKPEKLRATLEQRAKGFPHEFEPHANLAWLALKLGDLDTATASARMAVSLAPDPQRGEVLSLFAEIVHTKGDRKTEGEVRRFLVEYYESLPPVLAPVGALKRAKGALLVFEQSSL